MPVYEYHCDNCRREVEVTQSISEHGKGNVACPKCGNTALRPLVSSGTIRMRQWVCQFIVA